MFVPTYNNKYYGYSYQPLEAPFKAIAPIIADIYNSLNIADKANSADNNNSGTYKFYLGLPAVKNSNRYSLAPIGGSIALDKLRDELIGQEMPKFTAGTSIDYLLASYSYRYYIYDYLVLYAANRLNVIAAYKGFYNSSADYNMQDNLFDLNCRLVLPTNVAAFHQLYLQTLERQHLGSFNNPVTLEESKESPDLVEQFRWLLSTVIAEFSVDDVHYLMTPYGILNPYKSVLDNSDTKFDELLTIAEELHQKVNLKLLESS